MLNHLNGLVHAARTLYSDLLTQGGVGGVAAGIALVLAALGIYGVIAFMVATRTREIGVRVGFPSARRAAAVHPIIAIRAE